MKKIFAVLLAVMLMATAFVGCGDTEKTVKFGFGVYAYNSATDATEEAQGAGESVSVAAAVLVDDNGKIVKCVIDSADNTVNYGTDGVASVPANFRSKLEMGNDYGMAAYGTDLNGDGVVLEWYDQIAAFCNACIGKTADEVAALVVNGYGTDEVQTAGCTMAVADFVNAVVKAMANVTESSAIADDTLQIGVLTSADATDATEEADGSVELETTYVAAAVSANGKVSAMATDCYAATFTFTTEGVSTTDTTADVKTKREIGDNYGMVAYGADLNGDGVVLEWYAQADAFDSACVGLTSSEIAALAVNGYGVESVQTAGCTIAIADFVAAAVKAATLG